MSLEHFESICGTDSALIYVELEVEVSVPLFLRVCLQTGDLGLDIGAQGEPLGYRQDGKFIILRNEISSQHLGVILTNPLLHQPSPTKPRAEHSWHFT